MTAKNTKATFEIPDFNKFARKFDQFLGLIAPVSEAIFERLPALQPDANILDVACGTGEPGLTLARRNSRINILGIDAAPNMVEIAAQKAVEESIPNARFQVMSAEAMDLPDNSLDCVISRFGLGMFGDVEQSAKETLRVLDVDGSFVIAVWHDMTKNTFYKTLFETATSFADATKIESVGPAPGAIAQKHFESAGFKNIEASEFTWNYVFDSESTLMQMIESSAAHMLKAQFSALVEQARAEEVFSAILKQFDLWKKPDGSYHVPHTCLILQGSKL